MRIVSMAAGGMSNRGIAETLFVTVRTVEFHLSGAFRKLDVESRGELAGALEQGRVPEDGLEPPTRGL
jgi:DNA-binding NarL/FixJ family response regulator